MNFVGFEQLQGQGAPELMFNQVFIEPNLPETAGSNIHAAAGFLPGQQSYLKARRAISPGTSSSRATVARKSTVTGADPFPNSLSSRSL